MQLKSECKEILLQGHKQSFITFCLTLYILLGFSPDFLKIDPILQDFQVFQVLPDLPEPFVIFEKFLQYFFLPEPLYSAMKNIITSIFYNWS